MGKRIPDDLDRRRGQPPRNGAHLSSEVRAFIAEQVCAVVRDLAQVHCALADARYARGDRAWRRECLTAEQRKSIKKATRRVRAEAKKWLK